MARHRRIHCKSRADGWALGDDQRAVLMPVGRPGEDAWGQANNQRMLEEAEAYLAVFWGQANNLA